MNVFAKMCCWTAMNIEDTLKQKLVELWVEFYTSPLLLQSEELLKRDLGSGPWQTRVTELVGKLGDSITNGRPFPLDDQPKLLLLEALDQAIAKARAEPAAYLTGGIIPPKTEHEVLGSGWLLVRRPSPVVNPMHAEQSTHLRNSLRNHLIVPKQFPPYPPNPANKHVINIEIITETAIDGKLLREDLGSNQLAVWLGSFPDGVVPQWPQLTPQKRCSCEQLDQPCLRLDGVLNSLTQAKKSGARLVILPELAVCPQLKDEVIAWMNRNQSGFLLVVPGSFHEWDAESDSPPVNRTRLLNQHGEEIFQHEKFIPFGDEQMCYEVITPGDTVTLWITSLGIFTLAICRDFCEGEGWVRSLWETLAPDWVLVPSMSKQGGISAHLKQAKHINDYCGARVLMVNQWPEQSYPEKEQYKHGFAFPLPGGGRDTQEVTDNDRLKWLDIPDRVDYSKPSASVRATPPDES